MKIDSCTCGGIFDLANKEKRVHELEAKLEAPDFWDDNIAAQKVIGECNELKAWTIPYKEVKQRFENKTGGARIVPR